MISHLFLRSHLDLGGSGMILIGTGLVEMVFALPFMH